MPSDKVWENKKKYFCYDSDAKNFIVFGGGIALIAALIGIMIWLIAKHKNDKELMNPFYMGEGNSANNGALTPAQTAAIRNAAAAAPQQKSFSSMSKLPPAAAQNISIAYNPNNQYTRGANGAYGVGNRPSQFNMLADAAVMNAPANASANASLVANAATMNANASAMNAATMNASAPVMNAAVSANASFASANASFASANAAAASANAAAANASGSAPQPVDDGSIGGSSFGTADLISSMDPSSKPFVSNGNPEKDMVPSDPNGGFSSSKLMPSSWRQTAGDAQANGSSCTGANNWARFAPTKAGFNKFIYASRHATMGINTREPNPTGGIRVDAIRPPPSVALSGESVPFGDSSHRNDYLSIAAQN